MLTHLAFVQLKHWDPAMRELASQALSVISVFNPQLVIEKILPPLIKLCFDKVLNVRHGAILGVSEIIIGLSGHSGSHRNAVLDRAYKTLSLKERNIIKEETENQKAFKIMYEKISTGNYLQQCLPEGSEWRSQVTNLVQQIEEQKLYKGKGGEIIRGAVCHLIHCLCQAGINYTEKELNDIFETLKENFKHPNAEIQAEAARALKSYCDSYYSEPGKLTKNSLLVKNIIAIANQGASGTEGTIHVTRGLNMALGVLSDSLLKDQSLGLSDILLESLMNNCLPKGKDSDDAENRKQAVKSLTQVVSSLGFKNIKKEILKQIFDTLYKSVQDYALDRRGDVGSWVREESMRSLTKLVQLMAKSKDFYVEVLDVLGPEPQFYERFICAMLQQLVEKIDRVRAEAGKCLQTFFKFNAGSVCMFADKDKLSALFL